MGTEPLDDHSLVDAASAARADWRADEAEWTAAAYEQWCHGRTLVDRARDHLHHGDTIAVGLTAAPPVVGTVLGVGPDGLALRTAGGRVDVAVRAGIAWRVVEHAASGGDTGIAMAGFRARLLELEAAGSVVEVGAALPDGSTRGRLTIGRDHLVVTDDDGAVAVIGLVALEWVRVVG